MGINLRTRYDLKIRRRAVELFDEGLGVKSVGKLLGIPWGTVRQWRRTYEAVGIEVLLAETRYTRYDYETKVAAARAVVDDGRTKAETMDAFGIASISPLEKWCRLYRQGGAEALRPKPKGRPKGSRVAAKKMTREQELEQIIRKLEAENAYLKKSIALKAEKSSRIARKRSS